MGECLVEVGILKATHVLLILKPLAFQELLGSGTIARVLLQTIQDEPDSQWTDFFLDAAQVWLLFFHHLFKIINGRRLPDLSPSQHLIRHYTKSPNIDFVRVLFKFPELRCHVKLCSKTEFRRLFILVIEGAKAEICQLDSYFVRFFMIRFYDEDVLRLDISVGNLHSLMQILQGAQHLFYDVLCPNLRNGSIVRIGFQAAIFQVLHDNVKLAFILHHFHSFDNVLVLCLLNRNYLTLKQIQGLFLLVGDIELVNYLDCILLPSLLFLASMNRAKGTFANLLQHLVLVFKVFNLAWNKLVSDVWNKFDLIFLGLLWLL